MQTTGTIDINETVHAWADIVLKIWHNKITELQVWDSGELYESLKNTLFNAAGNNINKIEFSFKLYGIFVDMGVGKEVEKGNGGDLGFTPNRKRKEWYSRIFYREVMKLKEILMEKFGEGFAREIIFAMKPVKDLKYAHAKGLV